MSVVRIHAIGQLLVVVDLQNSTLVVVVNLFAVDMTDVCVGTGPGVVM